jgi:CPA2 family monovalent cation:H+ antiporter-2
MGIAGDFVLIVVAGLVGGLFARACRLPLLVGYVVAGVALGPNMGGPTVSSMDDVELLAELGVALLLFAIGLEVSLRDLEPVRKIALIGGPIQILVTGGLGALVAHGLTGMSWNDATWFGAMVSLSSTMVVLKMLSADGTTQTLASRVMIGLLVVQDLAVVPMLIVLPRIGALDGAGAAIGQALLIAVGFLGGMLIVGTRVLPWLLRQVLRLGSRELFLVSIVAAGVGVGYLTYRLELSFALGAFIAGLVLSESELSHQALSDVVPLRDIFALIFFVSVGMLFDPRYVLANAGLVAVVVVAMIVGKALLIGVLARSFGYIYMAPWLVGLGLAQIGEFSFVLARTGLSIGALGKDTYDLALSSTVVSMTLSPLVFLAARPLGRAWFRWRPLTQPPGSMTTRATGGHVIVAGYGRTGRAVATSLRDARVPTVVLELNHQTLESAGREGISDRVWGDVSSEEILRAAHVEQAQVLVIAVPDSQAVQLTIARARQLNPRLYIVARAATGGLMSRMAALGVDAVVQPEFEGGVEMMRQALRHLAYPEPDIERLTGEVRDALYARGR